MSYYTVTVRRIDVIGKIWQPGIGTCAMSYELRDYDVENIGEFTRENVQLWLDSNSGDFQSISDFRADIADFFSDWEDEESEGIFNDCMFGEFDEELAG
jgi:hypothetical protein